MADATYTEPVFIRGDMIASVSAQPWQQANPGDPDYGMVVPDVAAFGDTSDLYRLVWTVNVNGTSTQFENGQGWTLQVYDPAADPDGDPGTGNDGWSAVAGYANMTPKNDLAGGLGAGDEYIVLDAGSGNFVLYDINGGLPTTPTTLVYLGTDEQGDPGYGDNDGNLDFYDMYAAVVCFAAGTLIHTPRGPSPVETLKPGDLVSTADHGPQPVRVALCTPVVCHTDPQRRAPVLLRAGRLGPGLPANDLALSPQHRVLHQGARPCLVAAKALLATPAARRMLGRDIAAYYNLAFDRHEIVFAEGLAVESFYPGPEAAKGVSAITRIRLAALYPTLPKPARPFAPTNRWARRLADNPHGFRAIGRAAFEPIG